MQKKTTTGLELTRSISLESSSFNEADNTIDVTFSTETPVLTYIPYPVGEMAYEILSHDSNHVRMDRISQGLAPVLDNHDRYKGTKGVLGRVLSGSIQNKEGVAKLLLSKRDDIAGTIQDIKDKVLTQISAGYNVYVYELVRSAGPDSQYATYRAIDWEPREISFAPVNADINSRTRSADQANQDQNSNTVLILNNSTNTMENQVSAPNTQEQQRSAEPTTPAATTAAPAAPAATTAVTDPAEAQRAAAAERSRSAQIMDAVTKAGMPMSFAQEHIADGTAADQVRQLIIDQLAEKDPFNAQRNAGTHVTVGTDNKYESVRSGVEAAITARVNPGAELSEESKRLATNYRGYDLLRMAEEILIVRGIDVRGLSKNELAIRAMSTSDFPMLLGSIMNRQLRAPYEYEPEYWGKLSQQESASDFRSKGLLQVDKYNGMQKLKEGGEYKYATLLESSQTYKVETFGEGVKFTRQMLINDDLSAFSRIPQMFNKDWSDKRGDIMWDFILKNVKFSDDKALFHADHKNLGTAAALSEESLSAGRKAFRLQKDLKGSTIRIAPKYLIVGPELETAAEKLLSQIQATTTSNVNVFANKLELIVESRLEDKKEWYLAAQPGAVPMLLHAYLDGNEGLYSETSTEFDTDAVKMKVRGEFGGQIVDYRGFYKNPGQ